MEEQNQTSGMYLSRISNTYLPKNKFQKEVRERITKYDRLVMTDPEAFIAELKRFVNNIHFHHPRAGAMEFEIYRYSKEQGPSFCIGGIIHFTIEVIRGRWAENDINLFIPFPNHAGTKQ